METTLKIYLIGAAVSLLLNIILAALKDEVSVKNLIGYIVNVFLSWGFILTIIANNIVFMLTAKGKNTILWKHKNNKTNKRR
ncbi:MAG: hypothetical protein ACI30A_06590 [Paludibacteraceae bacterium]